MGDPGEPVILSEYLKNGETAKALEAALVKDFHPELEVTSYSGFITVNREHNSNLFFWYFPAEHNPETAPVIIWNDGGPGLSGMFSVFNTNGPFRRREDATTLNPHSWHKKHNLIYIDNPVTVGFSFTENDNGWVKSAGEAAADMYEFLLQFFQLFPNLKKSSLYTAGVSYGSKYAVKLAYHIHQANQLSPSLTLNLRGVISDAPWIHPISQLNYGDYLYTLGLIDDEGLTYFKDKEAEIRKLVGDEKYEDAFKIWFALVQQDTQKFTGFDAMSNVYNEQYLATSNHTDFITNLATRKAIHVGDRNFSWCNLDQQARMWKDFMGSSKSQLEALLKAGYQYLAYTGNMDALTGYTGLKNAIRSLDWDGAPALLSGKRSIVKLNDKVVGYLRSSQNASIMLFRNSGHGCLVEQAEAVFDIVTKFIDAKL